MGRSNQIKVPALVVVPGVSPGRNVGDYGIEPKDPKVYKGAPTLAELRHAYFDKNPDGSWICPEYRKSALLNKGKGEWTSTFLQDGKIVIERPENLEYSNGVWVAEGGKSENVELPSEGWVIEYDKPTGFPSNTSSSRSDAVKKFGDDASYFWYSSNGLRAVLRSFSILVDGPFCVAAHYEPGVGSSGFGVRSSSRLKQDASQRRRFGSCYRNLTKRIQKLHEY